uniref:FAM192A/Fyv6 N-terminal domain-containing protein n=1 Tax=Meloidogyne enterolobii TaxID=390850 RepID=A0A6V7XXQ6_MELEN|nr:unnamed protein product [Meloidogyne enterolobii]
MNFISEKEIVKKREENGDEEGNSDQQPDYRPLYERLKEVRDKKQLEWEEEHTLKNQFSVTRGIDEGDADFLEQVDRVRTEQEVKKRKEELELVKMAKQQNCVIPLEQQPPLLERPQKPITSNKNNANKQASLVSSLIRKRFFSFYLILKLLFDFLRSHSRTSTEDEACNQKIKKNSFASDDSSQGSTSTATSFDEPKKNEENLSKPSKGLISSVLDYSDTSDEEDEEKIGRKIEEETTNCQLLKNSPQNTKTN